MQNTFEIVDGRMIVMNDEGEVLGNAIIHSCRSAKRQIKIWTVQHPGIRIGEAMNLVERYCHENKIVGAAQ